MNKIKKKHTIVMKKSTLLKKLGNFVNVEQLQNNQIIINFENGKALQSYNSLVCVKLNDVYYLGKDYDYSRTTSKYLSQFCGLTAKGCKLALENGLNSVQLIKY